MRLSIFAIFLVLGLTCCQAGPAGKINEKRSISKDAKIEGIEDIERKEKLAIEDAGSDKDRSKKSTTTFCVEIRPGQEQPVQTPCICGETQPHTHPEPPPEPKPEPVPEPKPEPRPEPTEDSHSGQLVTPEEPEVQPLPDHHETYVIPACDETPMVVVPSSPMYFVPQPFNQPSAPLIHVPSAPLIHVPSSHAPFCPQYSRPGPAAMYTECTCRPKGVPMMRSDQSWMEPARMTEMEKSMGPMGPMGPMGRMQDPVVGTRHYHYHKMSDMPMYPVYMPSVSRCRSMEQPYVMSTRGGMERSKTMSSDPQGRTGTVISLHTGSHPVIRPYHDTRVDFYNRPIHHPHHGYGSTTASATGIYVNSSPFRMMPGDGSSSMYQMQEGPEMRRDMEVQMSPEMGRQMTEMRERASHEGEGLDMSRQMVSREATDFSGSKDSLKDEIRAEPVDSSVRNARSDGADEKIAVKEKESAKKE